MHSVSPFRDLTKWPNLNSEEHEEVTEEAPEYLLDAIIKGKEDLVRTMLKNELSPPYEKLLETAINSGQRDIVELLLQDEKDASNDTNTTPHHHRLIVKAAKDRDIQVLRLLLKDLLSESVSYSLQAVIGSGDISSLEALFAANIDANVGNGIALLQAVESNHHEMLRALIAHGADINSTYGRAALSAAVTKANPIMVNSLLDAGTNLADPQNTALLDVFSNHQYFIDRNVNLEILDALLQKQPNLQIKNSSGDTPLHLAARIAVITGNMKPFEMLWRAGADSYAKNKKEQTPLNILSKARPQTLEALQEIGLDLATILGQQASSFFRSRLEQFELADAPSVSNQYGADLGQSKKYAAQSAFPTREELLNAVRENNLRQIEDWIEKKNLNSEYDLGLAIIEAVKGGHPDIFSELLDQSQQPLWIEHRREAIRVAADKNLKYYIKPLLPTDPKEAAEFLGTALIAAAKAGHRDLAADMTNGASDQSLVLALENALQEGHLEIVKDLLAQIPEVLVRISNRIKQISSLLSTAAEKKDLLKTRQSIQNTLGSILKEAAEQGHLEIVNLLLGIKVENAISLLDKRIAIIRANLYGFSEIVEKIQNSYSIE